ncbi:alpha/beta hydrolase-fold protein [Tessaracoccus antarcticus]|nr:alpha/beta hydrolase-fold protein [Tessaracoccus antarcticus]
MSQVQNNGARRWGMPILGATLAVASWGMVASPSRADDVVEGSIVTSSMPAASAGLAVDYNVYLPAGYDAGQERYPSLYLFHGRGDTMAAWPRVKSTLDEMIADGEIPPVVVIMPDAPWSEGGSYYVDSDFDGGGGLPAGQQVETAMTKDLVTYVDTTYRTVASRNARAAGGYSMGGYGALRYTLAHQDLYAAGIILSPAVYIPTPPADSSAREFGAFGSGTSVFDESIYEQKNYPALLPGLDPATPTHLFIAVGDDEWMNPDPADADHDLDFEAARLYNTVRRSPAITAELRVLNGGHDWDVWGPAFREGVADVMGHVRTSDPQPLEGSLLGTVGDDRAGGIVPGANGGEVVALSVAGEFEGLAPQGGLDGVVVSRDADGNTVWSTSLATSENDRIYGVEAGPGNDHYVGGYTRGDLDGDHASPASDDGFAARVAGDGGLTWVTQFGDPSAADRVYATAPSVQGGLLVAGYTKGSLSGQPNAGDKDAFLALMTPAGEIAWSDQLGGTGEDKGLAIAQAPDGAVYVGGLASDAMPGAQSLGGLDGWLAKYTSEGVREWVTPVGTSGDDQVSALAITPDGNVVVAGFTSGALGEASAGGNDAFLRKVSPEGDTLWSTQVGSPGDDRATDVAVDMTGTATLAGHTDGRIGVSAGGTDVFTSTIDDSGHILGQRQVGTSERDGADTYDEGNLYVALGSDGDVVLTGLTYGSTTTATNKGEGDVFVVRLGTGDGPEPTPSPTPSTSPSETRSPTPTSSTSPMPSPSQTTTMTSPSPSWSMSDGAPSGGQTDLYSTPGLHHVNGRWWFTQCEDYSRTIRCRTEIWATQMSWTGGKLMKQNGWFFNNLTYLPRMKRQQWAGNPLGFTGAWTSADGRMWRTECDTPRTGGNGCRSSIRTRTVVASQTPGGGYSYTMEWTWVVNNIVRFR